MKRRDFFKYGAAIGGTIAGKGKDARAARRDSPAWSESLGGEAPQDTEFNAEYIVVGSGAGGGTVAARLVENGHSVLVLEAGGDPRTLTGGNPLHPESNTLPDDYDVPGFHVLATENDAMKWDFFVRHYADSARQARDPKYREVFNNKRVDGVWYPRGGTLGGCTAHSAMLLIYPHDSDWNRLADLTGDTSWRADHMRTYFERLENCRHRGFSRWLSKFGINPSRHGWGGWLHTELAEAGEAFKDRNLINAIIQSTLDGLNEVGLPGAARLAAKEDPNDWRVVKDGEIGLRYAPMTTRDHKRTGSRERLLEVRQRYPDRLRIELDALATRVLFDGSRAIGMEYRKGARLYRAHTNPSAASGELRRALASREVILSGGAFNTPQLLMLSGIGPRETLDSYGIPVIVDLPGVGRNLQDRYEISVVSRMSFPSWGVLKDAKFTKGDPQYNEWSAKRSGVYTSNGVLMAAVVRSTPGRPDPDLFCFATLSDFSGYSPGYSLDLVRNPNCLSWVVLKAHTNNTAGEVTLQSADPRDPPRINFHYFDEGNDASGDDVKAVVAGIKLVRKLTERLKKQGQIVKEELPGEQVDSDSAIEEFVKNHAWGHHASCTCPIGDRYKGGVLSSDFRVHGTQGLRVVDASVFPRTPGLFIVSAIYMIAEKAADVIAASNRR